jgi:hypothetical protein
MKTHCAAKASPNGRNQTKTRAKTYEEANVSGHFAQLTRFA